MSEELVERLRGWAFAYRAGRNPKWPLEAIEQAADTIEALTARIAQLEAELAGARDGVFELMDALGAMTGGDWELEGWAISEERCRELRDIAQEKTDERD